MITYFDRFEISMTRNQARNAAHSGDCTADVKTLAETPAIKRQLKRIDPDDIRAELKEFGAWDDTELKDNRANALRILWIAAGNIKEGTN